VATEGAHKSGSPIRYYSQWEPLNTENTAVHNLHYFLHEDVRKALAVIWFQTDTNNGDDSLSETSDSQDLRAIEITEDEDPVQNSQSATPVPADIIPVSEAPNEH
jgi:hypothetical protein